MPRPACGIHLDLHFWESPAGFAPSESEWRRESKRGDARRRSGGSPTAIPRRHSISGGTRRNHSCLSRCPGGFAQDASSSRGFEPPARELPEGCGLLGVAAGCGGMSGVWPSASGGNGRSEPEREHEIISSMGRMWPLPRTQIQRAVRNSDRVGRPPRENGRTVTAPSDSPFGSGTHPDVPEGE